VTHAATGEDPEFMAHLIAWNDEHGQVRDSKVALPVLFVQAYTKPDELRENGLAALAKLDPRNLVKACRFMRESPRRAGGARALRRVVERYLRVREENWAWWERTAVQHRASLKTLYALNRIKPNAMAEMILFQRMRPKGTIFFDIAELHNMSPVQAAGTILERKIPFLIAVGALGPKAKDEHLLIALIERMSPTELVTNSKMLKKLGVETIPALRAAYAQATEKASTSKKTTLKAGRASRAVGDSKTGKALEKLQEKQIDSLKGIEGDWLILADKSSSMQHAIEASRHIAATLARFVKGEVHLVFFDTSPRAVDVTGKTLEEIRKLTGHVSASGATSIGCGMQWARDKSLNVDGIAIVTDLAENNYPAFAPTYRRYCEETSKDPPVYLYVLGSPYEQSAWIFQFQETLRREAIDPQIFDLRGAAVDYYSLPNLVQTMRSNRYSLIDEIMAVPLLKLEEVLKKRAA
jgi:hypothetical protein